MAKDLGFFNFTVKVLFTFKLKALMFLFTARKNRGWDLISTFVLLEFMYFAKYCCAILKTVFSKIGKPEFYVKKDYSKRFFLGVNEYQFFSPDSISYQTITTNLTTTSKQLEQTKANRFMV